MSETGLLVEVPEAQPLVATWRERHDPVTARGIPAHITALWPFVPPGDLDSAVVARLRTVLRDVEPFDFRLDRVAEFPGAVWLNPEPDGPFRALTRALWTAFRDFRPYAGAFPESQPHLTVFVTDSAAAPAALRRQLDDDFAERLPVACRVTSLTVFASDEDGMWTRALVLEVGD